MSRVDRKGDREWDREWDCKEDREPPEERRRRSGAPPSRRKLTVEQVLEARWLHAQGKADFAQLAREYGVHHGAIKAAALGETFKELPMPPDTGPRR